MKSLYIGVRSILNILYSPFSLNTVSGTKHPARQFCCTTRQSCYTIKQSCYTIKQSCYTTRQSCTCTTRQSGNTILLHDPDNFADNPATQSCTRCRCVHDQTIRKHNPLKRPRQFRRQSVNTILHPMPLYARYVQILSAAQSDRKHNPAPTRPDNPGTQFCCTTRQSRNTILQDTCFLPIKVYNSIYDLFSGSLLDFHMLIDVLYLLCFLKGCKWLRI
jgi:hypothetical protein